MNIFDKNSYIFATGLLYQSVLSNKKSIDFKYVMALTNKLMYATTTKIRPTAGFCSPQDLAIDLSNKLPKIAALGIYIVECLDLSSKVEDCIICFRFDVSRYGYIVLINGTISPDSGECITELTGLKSAIIQKVKSNLNIKSIYVTSEVYSILANEVSLNEMNFEKIGVDKKNPNQFAYTSEDLFWSKKRLRLNFNKALIKDSRQVYKTKLRLGALILIVLVSSYGVYYVLHEDHVVLIEAPKPLPSNLALANQMITACLKDTDNYFKDLFSWSLTELNCTVNKRVLSFTAKDNFANSILEVENFRKTTNYYNDSHNVNSRSNIEVMQIRSNKAVELEKRLSLINIISRESPVIIKDRLINLSRYSNEYGFILELAPNDKTGNPTNKFKLQATVSPVFLAKHHILDHMLLKSIHMQFDQVRSVYKWTLEGTY